MSLQLRHQPMITATMAVMVVMEAIVVMVVEVACHLNNTPVKTQRMVNLLFPTGRSGSSFEDAITINIPVDATNKEMKLTIEKLLNTQNLLMNKEVLVSRIFEVLKDFRKTSVNRYAKLDLRSGSLKSNQRAAVFYYDEVKLWVEGRR